MADKDININLNVNSDKYESSIKKAGQATDKFNDELKDIPKTAKKAENALDKVSDETKKLEKSAKAGRLGVEALKDKLGALPVVGQTLSRSLDGVEGSFLSVAKAALPVAGIAGGLAAVGGAALLAYKNSEKLQGSIGRLGTEVVNLGTNLPIFESIGDALSVVTDNIADVIHNMNILNGTVLENTISRINEIKESNNNINQDYDKQLEYLKRIGAGEEEILAVEKQRAEALAKKGINEDRDKAIAGWKELSDNYNKAYDDYKKYGELVKSVGNSQDELSISLKASYENEQRLAKIRMEESKKAMDEESEALKDVNKSIDENINKVKDYTKAIEGVRSTDKTKIDDLQKYREQLKALRKEQEILNDTVLDSEEAEEKKRSDLQAQLPLLEKIYILEEQRGIANYNTLKDIKSTKAFLEDEESEVEKLKAAYDDLVESQNIRDALINSSNLEEARQKEIQDTQAQLTALENLYEAQVKAGEPAEETLETIKQLKDYLNDITKKTYDWKDNLTAALSITSSIGNLFGTAITAALDFSQIDLAPFDKAIEEAQSKLDAFNKWKEEQEEAEEEKSLEDYEERIALLDEEIEYAKEIGDKMSEIALENKKKEIQEEMEEEQKRIDKEKAINEEEKRLEHELALAEYHKEYANWQNQVKSAQTQKTKAIADSIIMPAQATGNAAIGVSQSFAQGGLVGLGLGLAASTGVIASAVSGAAGVKNASSALDSIQGNPPQPPQFQFGTTSYNVAAGESILVGEAGPELLSLKSGGNIAVESNAQVKAKGLLNNGDIYIDKVVFNVNKILSEEEIFKAMNNYKQRNSFMYTR